jgi:hypothetical protein
MNLNSDNMKKGRDFQKRVQLALAKACGSEFELEVKLPIGNPPKHHSFDLASADRKIVGECKAFAWTVSGNVPSAKITTLREAANYLLQLPADTIAFIAMDRDCHPIKGHALADYFARLNGHLLGRVSLLELSSDNILRIVHGRFPLTQALS